MNTTGKTSTQWFRSAENTKEIQTSNRVSRPQTICMFFVFTMKSISLPKTPACIVVVFVGCAIVIGVYLSVLRFRNQNHSFTHWIQLFFIGYKVRKGFQTTKRVSNHSMELSQTERKGNRNFNCIGSSSQQGVLQQVALQVATKKKDDATRVTKLRLLEQRCFGAGKCNNVATLGTILQ